MVWDWKRRWQNFTEPRGPKPGLRRRDPKNRDIHIGMGCSPLFKNASRVKEGEKKRG